MTQEKIQNVLFGGIRLDLKELNHLKVIIKVVILLSTSLCLN